jgi:hypothetical protein
MSNDELAPLPVSGLDIPLPLNEFHKEVEQVRLILDECENKKDPSLAFQYGRWLINSVQARGVAMAELLYGLSKLWTQFGLEEEFEDRIYNEWGISPQTTAKYTRMWRYVFDNPDVPANVKKSLIERPMATLKRLTRPAREGMLNDKDWNNIAKASDHHEVIQIIKKIDDAPPRGTKPLTIYLYPDGQLIAFCNGERAVIGILRCTKEDLVDDVRAKAYDRIIRSAGVLIK